MKIEAFFQNQNRHVRFLIGLYISRKRLERGFSVQETASQLGLTPQAYKRIEGGRSKLKSEYFDKIQSLLKLEIDELYEIRQISCVAFINELSKNLGTNYPV